MVNTKIKAITTAVTAPTLFAFEMGMAVTFAIADACGIADANDAARAFRFLNRCAKNGIMTGLGKDAEFTPHTYFDWAQNAMDED